VHVLCDAIDAGAADSEAMVGLSGDPVPPNTAELLAALDPSHVGRA
jgi:hypothetical protein